MYCLGCWFQTDTRLSNRYLFGTKQRKEAPGHHFHSLFPLQKCKVYVCCVVWSLNCLDSLQLTLQLSDYLGFYLYLFQLRHIVRKGPRLSSSNCNTACNCATRQAKKENTGVGGDKILQIEIVKESYVIKCNMLLFSFRLRLLIVGVVIRVEL